jgi:hypothetical protein
LNHVEITTAIHVMALVYQESIDNAKKFDDPLSSFTQNILSTTFKRWQERKNTFGLKKNRKKWN